jgi:glycosidase
MRRLFSFIASVLLLAACIPSTAPTSTPSPVPQPAVSPTSVPTATPQAGSAAWWDDTVFYEIFVRSFYDSDGDGIGDLQGVIAKLDYLSTLGIKGIWLMPIHPSPSYHGYDVTDYRAINPDYGTLDDYKQLLSEAHKRGIKVILDFVLNHTSVQHPWFIASQDPASDKRDWYIWSDTDPGYLGPWDEQVWYPGQSGYYYSVFDKGMADLNYRTPAVTQEMEATASFWLHDVGVDGLRLDGARHLIEQGRIQANTQATHDWYKQFYTFYKGVAPNAMVIGEVWDTAFATVPYVQNKEMDLVFNFDLAASYMAGVSSADATKLNDGMKFAITYFPPGQYGSFLTNHDMDRVMSQLGGDEERAKTAAVLYLTMPGVPFIYYGEEIGMLGAKPDEMIRTPMEWSAGPNAGFSSGTPWEPPNADYQSRNVAAQEGDPNSLLTLYRALVSLRNAHPALREGQWYPADSGNGAVFAALRATDGEAILVLLNLSDAPVQDYRLNLSNGPLQGQRSLQALLGEGTFNPLTANAGGGFTDFVPLATLPAHARLVVALK